MMERADSREEVLRLILAGAGELVQAVLVELGDPLADGARGQDGVRARRRAILAAAHADEERMDALE